MSRIGKLPISLAKGVEIKVSKGNLVTVKGPKGELTQQVDKDINVEIEEGTINVTRATNQKRHRELHGLYRSLINNMVNGVASGFTKELELVGVGYRASNRGQILEMQLGFSHPVVMYIPDEVTVETETVKGKNPIIKLSSIDNQLLGQVAAKIRSFRKPEPYKGKGIRFKGEEIRRKAGKAGGK
ncbi:MAG: 50S ribosomal protein L6 [Saprospiraceae bacterium]|mgnify:FL=1|jgi:large subunit ribosomal protein L6